MRTCVHLRISVWNLICGGFATVSTSIVSSLVILNYSPREVQASIAQEELRIKATSRVHIGLCLVGIIQRGDFRWFYHLQCRTCSFMPRNNSQILGVRPFLQRAPHAHCSSSSIRSNMQSSGVMRTEWNANLVDLVFRIIHRAVCCVGATQITFICWLLLPKENNVYSPAWGLFDWRLYAWDVYLSFYLILHVVYDTWWFTIHGRRIYSVEFGKTILNPWTYTNICKWFSQQSESVRLGFRISRHIQ